MASLRRIAILAGLSICGVFALGQYVRIFMIGSRWGNDNRRFGGAYGIVGGDGRALAMAFLPKSMDLFTAYKDAKGGCSQVATV